MLGTDQSGRHKTGLWSLYYFSSQVVASAHNSLLHGDKSGGKFYSFASVQDRVWILTMQGSHLDVVQGSPSSSD